MPQGRRYFSQESMRKLLAREEAARQITAPLYVEPVR